MNPGVCVSTCGLGDPPLGLALVDRRTVWETLGQLSNLGLRELRGRRGQLARASLCLRHRAPGVVRLCVTLAGVRAGRGRTRAGRERRAGLPPLQPSPPSSPLAGRWRPLAGFKKTAGLRAEPREGPPQETSGLKFSSSAGGCTHLASDKLLAVPGYGFDPSPSLLLPMGIISS